ncbi:hypothetical protein CBS101457_002509 [Exobasidium rhododendri]|nr:hypothetical protein CBS101457_002509 [Exobasidium rhododendri]
MLLAPISLAILTLATLSATSPLPQQPGGGGSASSADREWVRAHPARPGSHVSDGHLADDRIGRAAGLATGNDVMQRKMQERRGRLSKIREWREEQEEIEMIHKSDKGKGRTSPQGNVLLASPEKAHSDDMWVSVPMGLGGIASPLASPYSTPSHAYSLQPSTATYNYDATDGGVSHLSSPYRSPFYSDSPLETKTKNMAKGLYQRVKKGVKSLVSGTVSKNSKNVFQG